MRILIALVLVVGVTISSFAKSGEVTEYSLPNGLKLFVKEDHRAPVVVAQVWYKVGSSYESTGITGISHALEHMMFRGTKKYGPGMLDKIIVDNGGIHNAFTANDFTAYYEILSADKLSIIFDLEADRMQGLLLDESGFAKEKQVVIEERKMRTEDDPNGLLFERFMVAAYISNPYHNPVIGWMHDIQNLTTIDLKSWYRSWYAPNNAIVVVVGDVDPQKVFTLVQQYFGSIPSVNITKLKPQQEVLALGERRVVVKVPAKVPNLFLGYNVPTLKTVAEEQKWKVYALDVAQGILSSGASARLYKDLVRTGRIAVQAAAGYEPYSRLDNIFMLTGVPAPGHTVKELQTALLQQIKRLQKTLVSIEELERIKAQVISSKVYLKDNIESQAMEIGSLEAVGLSWREAEQYLENIKLVTPEQIQSVAKEFLILDRLTIAELQPLGIPENSEQIPQTNKKEEL